MSTSRPGPTANGNQAHLLLNPRAAVSVYGKKQAKLHNKSANGHTTPKPTTFDPRALLDPKHFPGNSPKQSNGIMSGASIQAEPEAVDLHSHGSSRIGNAAVVKASGQLEADSTLAAAPSVGALMENFLGVTQREARPQKRRKRDDGQGAEGQRKATFGGGGSNGGVLGQYMKEKRDEASKEAIHSEAIVDLTSGDQDDEVVVVRDSAHREVCYGLLDSVYVQAHMVPTPNANAVTLQDGFWPLMRVTLMRRKSGQNSIISVIDPSGMDFGTISVQTALGLAPLLDSKNPSIRTTARLPSRRMLSEEQVGEPTSGYYPIHINLYGQERYAKSVGGHLKQKGMRLLSTMQVESGVDLVNPHASWNRAPGAKFASEPGQPSMVYSRTIEEVRNDVIGVFDTLQQSEDLPEMECDSRITTPLLGHQKQALFFMTDKETEREIGQHDKDNPSLWRLRYGNNGQRKYYNVITGIEEKAQPPRVRGGILADMMGLGKSLSTLSLIMTTLEAAGEWAKHKPPKDHVGNPLLLNSKATLLVSPLSTIANWEDQIKQHIKANSLSYYIYHGNNRTNDIHKLATYDMIITTYSVVSSEFDKRSKKMQRDGVSPLQETNWFRIVLDEAHMIREQSTRQSKAICALSADRRWAVTGTPVQNRLDDLGALMKFLRIKPFDEKGGFVQYIMSPFKNADPDILPKLRILVDSITLRRLKDRIDLPKRTDTLMRLEFSSDERELYEIFAKDSSNKMRIVAGERQKGLGGKAYVHVLQGILRLRLICAHGKDLLGEEDLKILEGANQSSAIDLDDDTEPHLGLTRKQAFDTFKLMRETNADVCNQCDTKIDRKEPEVDAPSPGKEEILGFMTSCYQILCCDCITGYKTAIERARMDSTHAMCPLCNTYIPTAYFQLTRGGLDEDDEARVAKSGPVKNVKKVGRYSGPHTKAKALLMCLEASRTWSIENPDEPPEKSVVFSGWTTHLDLLQIALTSAGFKFVRLDGKMTRMQRTAALDDFRNDPSITAILVSIMAGGLGLNLTTANKVYVMEPQFNPAAEAQAIDRVHRLGQKREVTATRFVMEESFELKMLELQRKKQNLADLSMNQGSKLDRAEVTKRRLEDLRELFR